jgi:DNA ligase (NAD+)
VGDQTAEILAEAFGDLDRLMAASVEDLEAVEGIGRKTAESIAAWAELPQNRELLRRLKAAGLTWRQERAEAADGPLADLCFLITGRLEALSRGQAESRLKDLGAKIAPGMSKGVNYLIVGADPGSKLDKARKLGTPIKDEGWLLQVLEEGRILAE